MSVPHHTPEYIRLLNSVRSTVTSTLSNQLQPMNDLTITQTIYLELKFDTPDYPTRTIDMLRTLTVTGTDRLSVWHSLTSQYNLTFENVCLFSPPLLSKILGFSWLPYLFLGSRARLQSFLLLGSLAPPLICRPVLLSLHSTFLFLFTLVVVLTGQQCLINMHKNYEYCPKQMCEVVAPIFSRS